MTAEVTPRAPPFPDPREAIARIAALMRERRSFLITTHRSPDGDGIGTGTALANLLASMGKEVLCYDVDPVPYYLRFLPGVERWVQALPPGKVFDATFVVDTGDLARCFPGGAPLAQLGTKVLVDHHLTQKPFADVELIDVEAAANGIQVWELCRALGVRVARDVAVGIYVSILSDTGNFKYSCTDQRALAVAGEMVAAGVDPWEVTVHLHESHPAARWRLLAKILGTLEVSPDGLVATLTVERAWVDEAIREARVETGRPDFGEGDLIDGFVNYARAISGVEVAVQFQQNAGGDGYKMSFRSRGAVNVAAVAEQFGGGGHHNAAGADVGGDLAAVRARVFALVRAALQEAGLGH